MYWSSYNHPLFHIVIILENGHIVDSFQTAVQTAILQRGEDGVFWHLLTDVHVPFSILCMHVSCEYLQLQFVTVAIRDILLLLFVAGYNGWDSHGDWLVDQPHSSHHQQRGRHESHSEKEATETAAGWSTTEGEWMQAWMFYFLLCRVLNSNLEKLGAFSSLSSDFFSALGHKISSASGEERETSFLLQRLSVALQHFNAVLLHIFLSQDDSDQ